MKHHYVRNLAAIALVAGMLSGAPVWADHPANGKVDINTADTVALEGLPGIGPAKAKAVIEYRQKNGTFKTVEDLKNVAGIGDKTVEQLKDKVTVNGQ